MVLKLNYVFRYLCLRVHNYVHVSLLTVHPSLYLSLSLSHSLPLSILPYSSIPPPILSLSIDGPTSETCVRQHQ